MPRSLRVVLPGILVALAAASALAGVPDSVDAGLIPSYRLVRPDLAAAGQPTAAGIARLKALGFRTVVNLRTGAEGAAEERAAVEGQGLRYVNVPVTPEGFSLADVEAVEKVLDDKEAGPVLLHCASSNRVGGVWAVIEARKGRSAQEAEAAGRAAGLHSPAMVEAVHRVLVEAAGKSVKP